MRNPVGRSRWLTGEKSGFPPSRRGIRLRVPQSHLITQITPPPLAQQFYWGSFPRDRRAHPRAIYISLRHRAHGMPRRIDNPRDFADKECRYPRRVYGCTPWKNFLAGSAPFCYPLGLCSTRALNPQEQPRMLDRAIISKNSFRRIQTLKQPPSVT